MIKHFHTIGKHFVFLFICEDFAVGFLISQVNEYLKIVGKTSNLN